MVEKFYPAKNKALLIAQNTMFHILEGTGGIEIDFSVFHNWDDKLIFLEKGQYIKFLSDDFVVRRISFTEDEVFQNKDFKVLFKHLISVGYIDFLDCADCQRYLQSSILSNPSKILDVSTNQWYWQNPFKAKVEEYHLIFDVKDVVDQQFRNHLSSQAIADILKQFDLNPQKLITDKLGVTVKSMFSKKRITEIQREVGFTDKSIKEISYDYDFKDPAYFNRAFKQSAGKTPMQFREMQGYKPPDHFIEDVYDLISRFHEEQRQISFYADQLNLSVKTLSRKVSDKIQISIGQLIRQELVKTAKKYLKGGLSVKEVSYRLHFEEPSHFTSFFKHYTKQTPSEYLGG